MNTRADPPAWQSAALGLVDDLRDVFGDRLRSVVAYGPHIDGHSAAPLTCLALVSSHDLHDLEACARHTARWRRNRIATPLVLPETEFRRSLDAFPLEYGEIIRAHQRVYGSDPFDGVAIAQADLRRACETQIKSHLVHLREGFIESGGEPAAVASLVAASAPAFTALLRNVAWLSGGGDPRPQRGHSRRRPRRRHRRRRRRRHACARAAAATRAPAIPRVCFPSTSPPSSSSRSRRHWRV